MHHAKHFHLEEAIDNTLGHVGPEIQHHSLDKTQVITGVSNN